MNNGYQMRRVFRSEDRGVLLLRSQRWMLMSLFWRMRFMQFFSRYSSARSLICLICMLFFRLKSTSVSLQGRRVFGFICRTSEQLTEERFSPLSEERVLGRFSLQDRCLSLAWICGPLRLPSCSNSSRWNDNFLSMFCLQADFLPVTTLSLKDARGVCLADDSAVLTELVLSEPFLLKPDPSFFQGERLISRCDSSMFWMEISECVYQSELQSGTSVPLLLAKEGRSISVNLNEISSEEGKLGMWSIQKLQSRLPLTFQSTVCKNKGMIDHGVKVAIDRIGQFPVSRPRDSLTLLATNSVFLVRSAQPLTPSPQANLMIWKQLQHPSMHPTQDSAHEKRQYFSPRVQLSQALSVSPNLQSMQSGAQRVQQHASQQRQAKPQASIECH